MKRYFPLTYQDKKFSKDFLFKSFETVDAYVLGLYKHI